MGAAIKAQLTGTRYDQPRRTRATAIAATVIVSFICTLTALKIRFYAAPYDVPLYLEAHSASSLQPPRTILPPANASSDGDGAFNGAGNNGSAAGCFQQNKRSLVCKAIGDIRIVGATRTAYIDSLKEQRRVKPYARQNDTPAMNKVKEWTLSPFPAQPPQCDVNHSSVPAFVFSNGGFTGNLYHDFTDVLVPLFVSTYHLAGEVQFLVSGLRPRWVDKFLLIFKQLTRYDILDIDRHHEVHCYGSIIVGTTFHKDMGVDPSLTPTGYSMADFRRMLRAAYGLERESAAGPAAGRRPRLLVISRRKTRRFLNEKEIVAAAEEVGFDVEVMEPDKGTEMATVARRVNAADVMMGVHGAGLTNMVFLPEGAVLIQVVPFGRLDWLARVTFDEPAAEMGIRYMGHEVRLEESTIRRKFPPDHPAVRDPMEVHKGGWPAIEKTYLTDQDVRLDVHRLQETLRKALKRLPSQR